MAATYSLSVTATGAGAPNSYAPKVYQIDDNYCESPGAEQQAMSDGQAFLAKGPDGGTFWACYDTERCIPGVLRVIRRLY